MFLYTVSHFEPYFREFFNWSLLTTGNEDLPKLVELLKDVSYQWELIGLALHLLRPRLKALKADHLGEGQDRCLVAMLDKWLHWSYDYKKFGKPTWRMLVEALESVEDCTPTADQIKEEKPWSK